MLTNINIIDLAVVQSLNLDLRSGMSVLTGETGAGKSILLTALGLALGDRADSSYIRPGCKRAEINLNFDLQDAVLAQQWLIENDLDLDHQCIIRRTINQEGRSKAYINNRPVVLQLLQELSEKLVEIQGQHAHLHLLRSDMQRNLLDSYGNHKNLLTSLAKIYQLWQQNNKELTALNKINTNQLVQEELLRFQLQELEQLDLENFNYLALAEEHTKLVNLNHIFTTCQTQLNTLDENEQQSVNQMLVCTQVSIAKLFTLVPELEEISNLLAEAQIQTAEATQKLRRFLANQEANPQRINLLEDQLSVIHNLSRKHQIKPEQLPEIYQKLSTELETLDHNSEKIKQLNIVVAQHLSNYQNLNLQLTKKRQLSAAKLQQKITTTIRKLGMAQGNFEIHVNVLDPATPKISGNNHIEFRISANAGLPAKALNKVASGGELSRISLAIQVITRHDKTVPTMIFDEVDSGIGGGIAEIVGKALRALSNKHQVLCVTHLPQVAAQSHHHLFVTKDNQSNIVASSVTALNTQQRIQEIARMLGGINITQQTLAHAQEMLKLATRIK